MRVWSTDNVPTGERFAFWNDAVCDAFLRVRTERAMRSGFEGSIASSAFGPIHINRVSSGRHSVHRGRRAISTDTDGQFFVNLQLVGDCALSQDGRDQHVRRGELCFFDGTRPFELNFETDMALTCFLVPRDTLIARAIDVPNRVVHEFRRDGLGQLLSRFSIWLAEVAHSLPPAATREVGEMYLNLLALALNETPKTQDATRGSVRKVLFASICADIRLHASDPALDIVAVAAHAGIAVRTLQTWFNERGTCFSAYLLEQRLDLADRQLAKPSNNATVSEIAYACGFSDLSYFCRSFRRRFGVTPREWRMIAKTRTS